MNTLPVIAYFSGETTIESIIDFFIADTVIIVLFNLIYVKMDVLFYSAIRIFLVLFSLMLLYISLIYVPNNPISIRQDSFWKFISVIFIIYSYVFFLRGKEAFEIDKSFYKKEIIKRFFILLFIAILGNLLDGYLNNYLGYLLAIVTVKMALDFYILIEKRLSIERL